VHFVIDQPIAAERSAVERALSDPAYYEGLGGLPGIGTPEVLGRKESGSTCEVEVRYAFVGDLSPAVRAVIDPAKLTWVIATTYLFDEHTARFTVEPDHYTNLLACAGTSRYDVGGDGTVHHVEGTLEVKVPIVGRSVERGILGGLESHVAAEAEAIEHWVTAHA
jgi:hypothetical protein